jgi:hypothetical protein
VIPCFALAAMPVRAQSAGGAASITPSDVFERVAVLAHDSMAGRRTGTPGLERAAAYAAEEFARLGLEPFGEDGTYRQTFRLLEREVDLATSVVTSNRGTQWRMGAEVLRYSGETGPDGVSGPTVVLSGVFSDMAAIADLPLEDAVVLMVAPMRGGRFDPAVNAMLGAVRARNPAALAMVTALGPAEWEARTRRGLSGRVAEWRSGGAPVVYFHDDDVGPLLADVGFDLADARTHETPTASTLDGLELNVTVTFRVTGVVESPNIVGVLPGSDPDLVDEYVVFSAHIDHEGIRSGAEPDSIFNGADDNASGTAGVLELAEAFVSAETRPRRSMMFVLVSGEEQGLLGSDYFGARPPVPIDRMVANVNMDMIGRNAPDSIAAIGLEHSDLGATLRSVADEHAYLDMAVVDDPWPQLNLYFRSDHYNFARRGVPILFFTSGTHEDYHRQSDHTDKIDVDKEARLLQLIYHLGARVANADERPQWYRKSYESIVTDGR